ncbi:MAG TPA: GNAT family protein [Candidatus Bathyarchaeia archaeon]|nr:GNAT family protein [Candidatus Bathyarchaeia archaeon]
MFEGEKIRLRSIELTDVDDILKNFNNLKLRKFLSTPFPYAKEEEEDWIRNTWQNRRQGREYQFAIEEKVSKEFLGTCGLFDIDRIVRSCELGIAIHAEKNWSKGYGTDTMNVLLKFGFEYINLNRIQLRVFDFNERGIRTYEKVGFTNVGKLRQAHFFDGKYIDVIFMDILYDEWIKKNKE